MVKEQKWTYDQKGDRKVCKTLEQLYNNKNLDCSSFVSSLYNIFLKVHPGSNSSEMGTVADKPGSGFIKKPINGDWSKLQPGDILWRDGHVGLYIGDKMQIETNIPWYSKNPRKKAVSNKYTHFIRYVGN